MPEYAPEAVSEAFAQARVRFTEIEGWLSGVEAAALTHAELEERLGERGRELRGCCTRIWGRRGSSATTR